MAGHEGSVTGRGKISRRTFLGMTGAAAVAPVLATRGRAGFSSPASSNVIKFWNQPWGNTDIQPAGPADHPGLQALGRACPRPATR